jgi:hypothetical protein
MSPASADPHVLPIPLGTYRRRVDRAADAAGGWHYVKGDTAGIAAGLLQVRPRALLYQRRDHDVLREHTQLEFLEVQFRAPASALQPLVNLRGLYLGEAWEGDLDLSAFPHLEWLRVGEVRSAKILDAVFAAEYPRVRTFSVSKYPFTDLQAVAGSFPALELVSIGDTGKLRSLDGVEALAPTLDTASFYYAPKLESLEPLAGLHHLETLNIEKLKLVTDLDVVAEVPTLRYLSAELARITTIGPWKGHPNLEAVALHTPVDDRDASPLFTMPRLAAFSGPLARHYPEGAQLPDLADIPELEARFNDARVE